jgi:hypothetical protein
VQKQQPLGSPLQKQAPAPIVSQKPAAPETSLSPKSRPISPLNDFADTGSQMSMEVNTAGTGSVRVSEIH